MENFGMVVVFIYLVFAFYKVIQSDKERDEYFKKLEEEDKKREQEKKDK